MAAQLALVDDHEVVRRGVVDLLEGEPDLQVVAQAGSADEALARIPQATPDVAVVDVRLPDGNGIELCRELLSRTPGMRCLILTSFADDEALLGSVVAGASGFVLKQVVGADLIAAVRTDAEGGSLLDDRSTEAILARVRRRQDEADPLRRLTDQERAVLELIGAGMTNRQIAAELFLAEKTVKNYVSQLLSKLGMQRRTQAAVLATEVRRERRS